MIRHCGTVMRSSIVAFLSPIQRYHFTFDETNGHVQCMNPTHKTPISIQVDFDAIEIDCEQVISYTVKMMNRILISRFLFFFLRRFGKYFNDERCVWMWVWLVCSHEHWMPVPVNIMKIKWNRHWKSQPNPHGDTTITRTAHKKRLELLLNAEMSMDEH